MATYYRAKFSKWTKPIVSYSYLKNLASQLGGAMPKGKALTAIEMPDINSSIEFIDISSFDFRALNLLPDEVKPWNDQERETISSFFDRLGTIVPGLLALAVIGRRIKLIRTTALVFSDGRKPCALAGENTIILSDSFFSAPNALHSFAHELTHIADDAYFVAFSKEWIELAEPLMKQYREGNGTIDKTLFFQTKWPSEYACENLIEALAEYVACYATCKYFDSVELFEKTVAPLIVNPDTTIMQWKKTVSKAREARDNQNIELARREFEQACKLFPTKPFPYLQLAGIAASSADYKKTIFYTTKMIDSFKIVRSSSPIELNYIYLILRTFATTGRPEKTREFATWLLREYPNNTEIGKYS